VRRKETAILGEKDGKKPCASGDNYYEWKGRKVGGQKTQSLKSRYRSSFYPGIKPGSGETTRTRKYSLDLQSLERRRYK